MKFHCHLRSLQRSRWWQTHTCVFGDLGMLGKNVKFWKTVGSPRSLLSGGRPLAVWFRWKDCGKLIRTATSLLPTTHPTVKYPVPYIICFFSYPYSNHLFFQNPNHCTRTWKKATNGVERLGFQIGSFDHSRLISVSWLFFFFFNDQWVY